VRLVVVTRGRIWADELSVEPLMIALGVVVLDVFAQEIAEVPFTEDHKVGYSARTDLTKRSAYGLQFGPLAGIGTPSTPPDAVGDDEHLELFGPDAQRARSLLRCRIGVRTLAFASCAPQVEVHGLLASFRNALPPSPLPARPACLAARP
jgi:hypothetical protein